MYNKEDLNNSVKKIVQWLIIIEAISQGIHHIINQFIG